MYPGDFFLKLMCDFFLDLHIHVDKKSNTPIHIIQPTCKINPLLIHQFCVADACKRPYQVSGTSASCPVMAGLITRVNALRMNVNKKSLGALGPAMYHLYDTNPELFHDITSCDNKCTASCNNPR